MAKKKNQHRTVHGQQRHREGDRPTREVFQDKGIPMKLHQQKNVADVFLFDVEVSEAELELYQQCLEYVLAHAKAKQIEEEFGAYPDEVEGMLEDIRDILQQSGVYDDTDEKSSQLSQLEAA